MVRNILLLLLFSIIAAGTFLFYYAKNIFQNNDIAVQYPPTHPNLVKETALILDLGAKGIELLPLPPKRPNTSDGLQPQMISYTFFDIDNDHFAELLSWPNGTDGFIVYDKNKNGDIDNQGELFGKDLEYTNGFLKLSQYDSNKDGVISDRDTEYNALKIWVDINKNGLSDKNELHTLKDMNIEEINLSPTRLLPQVNAGNIVNFESSYTMNGQRLPIQDIQLQKNNALTRYQEPVQLDVRVLFLPTLRGYGNLPDLHVAMSKDPLLLKDVSDLVIALNKDLLKEPQKLEDSFRTILYRWAGCADIKSDSRGPYADARKLIFMEKITGARFAEEAGYPYTQPLRAQEGIEVVEQPFQDLYLLHLSFFVSQVLSNRLYDKEPSYNLIIGTPMDGHLSLEGAKYLEKLAENIPTEKRRNFWQVAMQIILITKQNNAIKQDEIDFLNNAIIKTLPTENYQSIKTVLGI